MSQQILWRGVDCTKYLYNQFNHITWSYWRDMGLALFTFSNNVSPRMPCTVLRYHTRYDHVHSVVFRVSSHRVTRNILSSRCWPSCDVEFGLKKMNVIVSLKTATFETPRTPPKLLVNIRLNRSFDWFFYFIPNFRVYFGKNVWNVGVLRSVDSSYDKTMYRGLVKFRTH